MPSDRNSDFRPPRATPAQLKILQEAQEERGLNVDFSAFFPFLTRNQADVIIRGLVVLSETIRQSNQRFLHPRDLRLAVRYYLEDLEDNANVDEALPDCDDPRFQPDPRDL
jgi:hypothetical protein